LAARYGVLLIPRRIFMGVITADGSTLDSIHLTREGHQRMAEVVWSLIQTAYVN
jgi:lysophospholipase L1-like esterase